MSDLDEILEFLSSLSGERVTSVEVSYFCVTIEIVANICFVFKINKEFEFTVAGGQREVFDPSLIPGGVRNQSFPLINIIGISIKEVKILGRDLIFFWSDGSSLCVKVAAADFEPYIIMGYEASASELVFLHAA